VRRCIQRRDHVRQDEVPYSCTRGERAEIGCSTCPR
jgi:hypothetical protein